MPPNISYLYSCFSINVQFNICRALAVQEVNKMIQFVILFSKQAKPRLQKWFQAYPEKVDTEFSTGLFRKFWNGFPQDRVAEAR